MHHQMTKIVCSWCDESLTRDEVAQGAELTCSQCEDDPRRDRKDRTIYKEVEDEIDD